jgi:hypothetical protein
MTYSNYRVVALVGFVVIILVLGAIIAVYSVTWSVVFVAVFLVGGIPAMLIAQSRFQKRVDDSGGEFPVAFGGLGMMERDIANDRQGDLTEEDREELGEEPAEQSVSATALPCRPQETQAEPDSALAIPFTGARRRTVHLPPPRTGLPAPRPG